MFKIECFCDDKKLGQLLMVMTGLAYDVTPTPVANAKRVGKAVKQVAGSRLELLLSELAKRKLKEFAASDCKPIMVEAGLPAEGYSAPLAQAIEMGLVKKLPANNQKYQRYKLTGRKLKS